MSPLARLLLVVGVMAVALGFAWWARRGLALRRRRFALPDTLQPPVLFASETCATCSRVRRIVADLDLDVTEVVWEEHPDRFAEAGIDRVPVFVWTDTAGETWRVDGVASAARMRRWLQ